MEEYINNFIKCTKLEPDEANKSIQYMNNNYELNKEKLNKLFQKPGIQVNTNGTFKDFINSLLIYWNNDSLKDNQAYIGNIIGGMWRIYDFLALMNSNYKNQI